MGEVQLDYLVPASDLAPYVTLFYHFRAAIPLFDELERADHAQFRFRLSAGEADYRFPDGSCQSAAPSHIIGATSGAIRTRAAGPVEVFGMGLTPAGWDALVGGDASTMTNCVLDADALFGPTVAETAARLRAMAGDRLAMAAVVEPLLRTLVATANGATLAFVQAVDAWLAGAVSPVIEDLVAATGLSRRHVERRCNALYGAPPKVLARKYRALRAAVAMASGATFDPGLIDGFYDQSHMIREIKQFTGLTPKRLREEPGVLAQLTISQRRALAGQVHPIISGT